jgi:flavin reductase (DIM6/NTAB) family NADH-FMN oxidoreductase RutF
MQVDFDALTPPQRYKLLTSLVVPRPIAFTSTIDENGVVNAAPYSYFNALGDDPPIVIISADARSDGTTKDTTRNILASKEFVVNLVDEAIAEKMHACSEEMPRGVSELDVVGLHSAASVRVKPPRILEAPVSMECRLHTALDFKTRQLMIGEVLYMHIRDGIVDPKTLRRNPGSYRPVGRLYANRYCTTAEELVFDKNQFVEAMSKMGRFEV